MPCVLGRSSRYKGYPTRVSAHSSTKRPTARTNPRTKAKTATPCELNRFHQATTPQRKIMRIDTTELASDFRRGWRKRLEKRRWCTRAFDGNGSLRLILWQTLVMVHCRGIRYVSQFAFCIYRSCLKPPSSIALARFAPRLKVTCGWLCHIAYSK